MHDGLKASLRSHYDGAVSDWTFMVASPVETRMRGQIRGNSMWEPRGEHGGMESPGEHMDCRVHRKAGQCDESWGDPGFH